jgi:nicotinate phosphoribosyltransferase
MPGDEGPTTGLLTDLYELTMVQATLHSGVAEHPSCFELFARRLPAGRRYGVVAGTGRLAEAIARFRFDDDDLAYLHSLEIFDERTLGWFADYRFSGTVEAYREGDLYFPGSPVVSVRGTFAEAVLLETLALSLYNQASAVASAAARMHEVAAGRLLIEMGSRRTHEQAAVEAARAAYLVGFGGTSNLEAGRRHGIPVYGTAAHAYVLAHADERAAFAAQLDALGMDTTLLIDTYDITEGIDEAIAAGMRAGGPPGAIRIDSGDLGREAEKARAQLDAAGCAATKIVASGDLDEFSIAKLAAAPTDAYGVGTSVVTGSGHPTANMIYKLVAVADRPGGDLQPVAKTSVGKATVGGRKFPFRMLDEQGLATDEALLVDGDTPPQHARALHVPVFADGEATYPYDLEADRGLHLRARAELPASARALEPGEPWLTGSVRPGP